MAVEAAIFVPLFVIGILTLGYMIRFAMTEEHVTDAMTDEAHRIMAQSAIMPWPALVPPPFAASDIEDRVLKEGGRFCDFAKTEPLLYRVPGYGIGNGKEYSDLIGFSVSYRVPVRIPRLFRNSISGEETVLCRAFVGRDNSGDPMPFSDMEDSESGRTVWVFPRAGEKYHGENCRVIKNEPRERLLDRSVRSAYKPCKLCHAADAKNGTLVYVFPRNGKAYHLADCTQVKRYVIEMSEKEAKEKGYTKCKICGGK
jgi:hypothetical protein